MMAEVYPGVDDPAPGQPLDLSSFCPRLGQADGRVFAQVSRRLSPASLATRSPATSLDAEGRSRQTKVGQFIALAGHLQLAS
jgi:hypothetical protein